MKAKEIILTLLISIFIFNTGFALEEPVQKDFIQEKTKVSLTMEAAVKLGIENSVDLKLVKNEIDLSALKQDRAEYLSRKLKDGEEKISEGSKAISENQRLLDQSSEKLEEAQQALDNGIVPIDIDLGNGTIITAGTSLDSLGDSKDLVESEIQEEIDSKEETLEQQQELLDSKADALESGELTLIDSLQEAGTTISEKLKFESLEALSTGSTSNLMTTMADVSYEVTSASYDIYKNQIAMLIEKNYYDVLKAKKILEVKEKAMERGKKQYQFTKDSYEVGMKAKDDMLLADVYYKGTEIEYRKARGELENALMELKKNLNIPFNTKLELTDVLVDEREIPDLEEGLISGLKNRLEIKKALGEVAIYDLNYEVTQRKYTDNTFQYREAELLKTKARLNYDKVFQSTEASIRQSYETLITVGDMMEKAKDMVEKAQESVEIANYKYKEGFGVESSLLKKLDLESAAGTIVEVLAAEENLSSVEEKIVEILYGYNLAKTKYYNDIAKFVY